MKRLTIISAIFVALLAAVSCEKVYDRPEEPIVIFDLENYPIISDYVSADVEIEDIDVTLYYEKGYGLDVEVSIVESMGIYSDPRIVTLEQEDGYIVIPLQGYTTETGTLEVQVKVSYGVYNIFSTLTFGVRPDNIDPIEIISTPVMEDAIFFTDVNNCAYITVEYRNGWSRQIGAKFEAENGDEGYSSEFLYYTLTFDGADGQIDIPVVGCPTLSGDTNLKMTIELEDTEGTTSYDFPISVGIPVPFVEETIQHTIIVTDRNTLTASDSVTPEWQTFEYKTVLVDMDGDGYVSGNHEIWLDRNLGATSTDVTSTDSYGFIYQGLRVAPGYISGSQANIEVSYGEGYKIDPARWYNNTGSDRSFDYYDTDGKTSLGSVTVVDDTIGPMNPCPEGYRLPKSTEINLLLAYTNSSATAIQNSALNLPFSGIHDGNSTSEIDTTSGGFWGAPTGTGNTQSLKISGTTAQSKGYTRGSGLAVRCIKAEDAEMVTYTYPAIKTE